MINSKRTSFRRSARYSTLVGAFATHAAIHPAAYIGPGKRKGPNKLELEPSLWELHTVGAAAPYPHARTTP